MCKLLKIYVNFILAENESKRCYIHHVRCILNSFLLFDTSNQDMDCICYMNYLFA